MKRDALASMLDKVRNMALYIIMQWFVVQQTQAIATGRYTLHRATARDNLHSKSCCKMNGPMYIMQRAN